MKVLNISKHLGIAAILFSAVLVSCNSSSETDVTSDSDSIAVTENQSDAAQSATAVISGTYSDTSLTGSATFSQSNGNVNLVLAVTAPAKANKSVAVHLHEHGDCGDMGKEAHGHWNPTNKEHGKWGEGNFHSGDIGNVQLDADGHGTLTIDSNIWTIGGDSTTNILNKAVIVHGGVDDYTTQPTGNAGNRIGCGVITN